MLTMKTKVIALQTVLIVAIIAALVAPCIAQTTSDDATAALLKRVTELEKSLAEVKSQLSAQPTAVPTPLAPAPPIAASPTPVGPTPSPAAIDTDQAPKEDNHTLGPLQFRGFSDFGFGRPLFEKMPETGLPGSPESFTVGDFDLFVNANMGDRLKVLGEVLVTSDFTNSFGAEIDRLMLSYKVNDRLTVSLGKFNTAIGYYTNEFHRARYFQTATSRPILFADEDNGGILPLHSIGMSATGPIPSGHLGLHWVAEIANGRSLQNNGVPVQNFVDENNGKATNFALYARPDWIHGFQTGVSFYRDTIHPAGIASLDQHIYSAHVALVRPHLELIGESVLLQHISTISSARFNSTSSYAQASYKMGLVRPYFRYEYQNMAVGDPVFGLLGRENGPSAGFRFDVSDFSCLKIQYGRLALRSGNSANDVQAQVAIVF
jgi:hypothetical protein